MTKLYEGPSLKLNNFHVIVTNVVLMHAE